MIRRPPRSTHCISSAASDVYKRQPLTSLNLKSPGFESAKPQLLGESLQWIGSASTSAWFLYTPSTTGKQQDPIASPTRVKKQALETVPEEIISAFPGPSSFTSFIFFEILKLRDHLKLSLIHISEPTRLGMISYAVFCLKKKKKTTRHT
eukprot:TRINITY_DN27684_c0_g1_i2.p3 TRINITY_DN27684_c0_g1~~TRINITY_DN27684_c0_g1_i2.p3  ORF type:complete len:150 (-),score=35.36 TRINITY_DN27684_c0_g1_i2:58-507(-)